MAPSWAENAIARGIVTMNLNLSIPQHRVAEFCQANGIARLAIFGSALREDFGPESDIDVMVSFNEDVHHTLFDMSRMEAELKEIFGREVDLVSQRGIESSSNHLRRKAILESAEPVYGS
jgi:predicted nucleotidyltransferase